jgi:hypothetical protein
MTKKNILKNVSKTWELEFAKRIKDKNVLNPPLRTAGPIYLRDFFARSKRVPLDIKYSCVICAGQSTHNPILMMRFVEETVSIVRPQKCLNPATLTRVSTTQATTCRHPSQLDNKINVVKLIQIIARIKFRYNSQAITSSVSHAAYPLLN